MIAKLIAHGETRQDALAKLRDALAETEVEGVVTNLPFLRWLVTHPNVRAGHTTTAFLVENPPLSEPPPDPRTQRGAAAGASTSQLPPRSRRRTSTAPRTSTPRRAPSRAR